MKKIRFSLFGRIVLAILCGVALGFAFAHLGSAGDACVRTFKTFNVLFSQMLKFIVPLLILGLVTPAIADVGKGAGKMLIVVMALSYLSTVAAGFFAYGCASSLLPHYVSEGLIANAGNGKPFLPFFELKIPPVCDVLTALALAFMVGVGIVFSGGGALKRGMDEFGAIVKLTIMRVIIPGLPIYIMTMICEMTAAGKFAAAAGTMFKVIATGWSLTIVYLVILYVLAGVISGKNPFRALWNMLPAYLTGLSIASSSAVIPVTLECCEKNGVSKDIRNFVVPLCANVHMVGSAIKLLTSAYAIVIIYGLDVPFALIVNFICMMAIAAVAAPGVMGGVLMASVGLLESILHFTPEQTALMMTFYLALDGYGPAANVTGDAAIAMVCDRFFGKGRAKPSQPSPSLVADAQGRASLPSKPPKPSKLSKPSPNGTFRTFLILSAAALALNGQAASGPGAELRLTGRDGTTRTIRREMAHMPDGAWRLRFATEEMAGLRAVEVVPDMARVPKGEGCWVFPDGHYGNFTRDEGAYSNRRARLAMYGVCRPQGTFVALVKGLRTEFTSHVVAKKGVYELFPRFELEKIESTPYEDIVIDCYPLAGDDANYSGMARRYRAWQLARGEVRPLAEKAKASPALDYSTKSIFLRCKFGRTFRRDVDHRSFATNTPPMTVDHTFDDFMGIMRGVKALGMDAVDMCLVGWQREGHDGPFPDHFPVDARFGGEAKMREAVKLGHDLGYRMSVHLNYHNYYPAAKRWRVEDVCKGPDGKPRPYWLLPAGQAHFSCFEVMVNKYVDSDFAHLRDIGIDGILHHDVTSAEYPTPCHDPRHPNNRAQMADWQLKLCGKCRDTFGGSSSESGLDHIAHGLDNILYVAWDVKKNPLIDGMLPIWPIVYNGICMSQPFYGTIDAPYPRIKGEKLSEGTAAYHWIPTPEARMLKVFEWGGRPAFYYNDYADLRPMKRMYDLWQPLKHLQLVFIHDHETLAPGVTVTRYENGEEVVCNAGDVPFCYRGETVASGSYRLVDARRGLPDVKEIRLEGEYPGHLQDVWYDGKGTIWWAHTKHLVKTDLSGKVLKKVAVEGHHAGIELKDGKLYVAVCPLQGKTKGKTTPDCRVTVGEYDAETLDLIKLHVTDINDRSGSLAILADGTFVVGCLRPQDISKSQVRFHHLDKDFTLIKSYVVDNVPVKLGIEVIKRQGDFIYLNMYGEPGMVKLDKDFKEVGRGTLRGAMGLVFDGKFNWIGHSVKKDKSDPKSPWISSLVRTKAEIVK